MNYNELRSLMSSKVVNDDSPNSRQRFANLSAALTSFQRHAGVSNANRVGPELRRDFAEHLQRYTRALQSAGSSRTRIRDQRSLVRRWHELAVEATEREHIASLKTPLQREIESHLKRLKISRWRLAQRCAVSKQSLAHWLRGGHPNIRSKAALERLEREIGLEPGSLVKLIPGTGQKAAPRIEFREHLSARARDPYYLPAKNIPESFRSEWMSFLAYKTTCIPFLERQTKGVWRLRPVKDLPHDCRVWWAQPDSGVVATTALLAFARVRAFIGALHRIEGKGLTPTLAYYADSRRFDRYLDFALSRSRNVVHGGIVGHLQFALSLIHPETGYLTQHPEFASILGVPPEQWKDHCAKCFAHMKKRRKGLERVAKPSRDVWAPLQPLLGHHYPLLPFLDGLASYRKSIDQMLPRSVGWAVAIRNYALLTMLAANPLRAQNYTMMTVSEDQRGHLRRSPSGEWRLVFQPEEFKNLDGAAKDRVYDVAVANWAIPALELWLHEARPVLLRGDSNLVFVSSHHDVQGTPWSTLDRAVFSTVRRLLPETSGFGPHSLRHLVATTWLRARPGAYRQVAELLHDRLDTVLKHYGHLDVARGNAEYAQAIEGLYRSSLGTSFVR